MRTTPVSASDYLRNGDLVRAVGAAIGKVLGEHADACPLPGHAARVREWERRAPEAWYARMSPSVDARPAELAGLQEERLIEFVRDPHTPALDADAWAAFLSSIGDGENAAPPEHEFALLTELQQRFAHALAVVTRDDHRAEVALNWLTAGEALRLQEQSAERQERTRGAVESVHGFLQGRSEPTLPPFEIALLSTLMSDQAEARLQELVATGELTAGRLEELRRAQSADEFLWARCAERLGAGEPVDDRLVEDAYRLALTSAEELERLQLIERALPHQYLARWARKAYPLLLLGRGTPPGVSDWTWAQRLVHEEWLRLARDEDAGAWLRWTALHECFGATDEAGEPLLVTSDLERAVVWSAAVSSGACDRARERLAAAYLLEDRRADAIRVQRERVAALPHGDPRRARALGELVRLLERRSEERLELCRAQLRAAVAGGFAEDVVRAHADCMDELAARGEDSGAAQHGWAALELCRGFGLYETAFSVVPGIPADDPACAAAMLSLLPELRGILDRKDLGSAIDWIARAQEAVGAPDGAVEVLGEGVCLALASGDVDRARELSCRAARVLDRLGRTHDAVALLLRAAQLAPDEREILDGPWTTLIRIHLAHGEVDEACAVFLDKHHLFPYGDPLELRSAAENAGRTEVVETFDARPQVASKEAAETRDALDDLAAPIRGRRWDEVERGLSSWLGPDAAVSVEGTDRLVRLLLANDGAHQLVTLCELFVARGRAEDAHGAYVWSMVLEWLRLAAEAPAIAGDPDAAARVCRMQVLVSALAGFGMPYPACTDADLVDLTSIDRLDAERRVAAARSRGDRRALADALEGLALTCSAVEDQVAAMDFLTVEVWTPKGLETQHVLFAVDLATRRVEVAGITAHPTESFMAQVARNLTDPGDGFLRDHAALIIDRDSKFTESFRDALTQVGVDVLCTPYMAPNANAFAERFVLSIKSECLERMIFFGRRRFQRAVREYIAHFNGERHHQGIDAVPVPRNQGARPGPVRSKDRLGGLLRHYSRAAA